jgi:hypothetical protein
MSTGTLRTWYDDASNVTIALMVLVVALILYGTLILQQLLGVVALAAPVVLLYLLWRLVLAVERVAQATEVVAAEGLAGEE